MAELKPIIEESFTQYAGAVLQSRALVDVRDCLKPSARQIFYCLYTDKFLYNKPFKKTLKAIGSISRMYIHGDSSAQGVIMRAGQPFAMRYPLVEVDGNGGTLAMSGNWAAARYTSSRLSEFSNFLFEDIDKNTILEWRDNYDDTEQYPTVLPSKGFYNIVNGTLGIGVGAASSVPQFNLKEVNKALIHLLWNPECDFEEIYCAPDFATGGHLLNEEEVKVSLKNGYGNSCKLRSVVDYDTKERCFIVKEIPYGVYTNTICGELEAIINGEDNLYFDRFNDLTGDKPLIKIYLKRNANANKAIKFLYKETSLESYYGINMTMLENGRFPKVFSWKEALQQHLIHEIEVYTKGFKFDLEKIKNRLHIVEGILIALNAIEEVINTIKQSSSTKEANINLQKNFSLTEIQAKAILEIKLARLAHLEIQKFVNEKNDLLLKKEEIEKILNDENLLKKEVEKGLIRVAEKFGDERRTKVLNIENEEDEPKEIKTLSVTLTNQNNIFVNEVSSLYTQKRGGVGTKFKLNKEEYIISSIVAENTDTLLFFSKELGNCYNLSGGTLPLNEKVALESLLNLKSFEHIISMTSFNKKEIKENIIFITKNGMLKKSKFIDYKTKRTGGIKALELNTNDELCSVIFTDDENIGILTNEGQFLICKTTDVNAIGRVTKGVKGIKLNDNDYVVSAKIIPNTTKEIISITKNGYIKKSDISEFNLSNRYTKGGKLQKTNNDDNCIDFLPLNEEKQIIIISNNSQIKINTFEIPTLSKNTLGNRSMKLNENSYVIGITK